MPTDPAEEAKMIWLAKEKLWNENVEAKIIDPIGSSGGIDNKDVWHQTLAAAFGRSLETFRSVQRLSNPREPRQFWADAIVLTRLHFETLVTLEKMSAPFRGILPLERPASLSHPVDTSLY